MSKTNSMVQDNNQRHHLEALIQQLRALRKSMVDLEGLHDDAGPPHDTHRTSQSNLLHYIAFRRQDLRHLQQALAELGLSSLGRAEAHVLASVDAVLNALSSLLGKEPGARLPEHSSDFRIGAQLLDSHSETLLGPRPQQRSVRIMVTLPSEAEDDYALIHDLVERGMEVARINCAHDGPAAWSRMIRHVRRAQEEVGRSCRVLMDLAGPKLRTGPVEPGPAVQKWRPTRDSLGLVVRPARIWLTAIDKPTSPPTAADAVLPVFSDWLSSLRSGNAVHLVDSRGSKRHLNVVDVSLGGCWAECGQTAYITPGLSLRLHAAADPERATATIGAFDPKPGAIDLAAGDTLVLTREVLPGRPAIRDSVGKVLTPAHIACTVPEIFDDVCEGERVLFDDGRIGGTIEKVEWNRIFVRITRAGAEGEKLRGEKGINLPDSALRLPALTAKDLEDLAFVVANADLVGLSFAQSPADVRALLDHIEALGRTDLGIILKIETRKGFEQLPSMLLAGMRSAGLGVMIARGDLAVESGFERMAEVQEEILWICESAHCPVVWATQVLETLAKEGVPSRAEISDAAMGHRAEAVMLNKGPHILKAVETLSNILQRMEAHQSKKQSMLRELQLARAFVEEPAGATDAQLQHPSQREHDVA